MVVRLFVLMLIMAAVAVGCSGTPGVTPEEGGTPTAAPPLETAAASPSPEREQETPSATATASPATSEAMETAEPDNGDSEVTMTPTSENLGRDLPQVTFALNDLAQRLGVSLDAIEVLEVEAKVWPDSSMGCPEPGLAYTQVQQDGVLIRLRVEGQVYSYHSGGGREPFLCEQKLGAEPATEQLTPIPLDGLITRSPED